MIKPSRTAVYHFETKQIVRQLHELSVKYNVPTNKMTVIFTEDADQTTWEVVFNLD